MGLSTRHVNRLYTASVANMRPIRDLLAEMVSVPEEQAGLVAIRRLGYQDWIEVDNWADIEIESITSPITGVELLRSSDGPPPGPSAGWMWC